MSVKKDVNTKIQKEKDECEERYEYEDTERKR